MHKFLSFFIILLFVISCDNNKLESTNNDNILKRTEVYEKTNEFGDKRTVKLIFLADLISEVISTLVDSDGETTSSKHGYVTYNSEAKIIKLESLYENSKGERNPSVLLEGDEDFAEAVKELEDLLEEVKTAPRKRVK